MNSSEQTNGQADGRTEINATGGGGIRTYDLRIMSLVFYHWASRVSCPSLPISWLIYICSYSGFFPGCCTLQSSGRFFNNLQFAQLVLNTTLNLLFPTISFIWRNWLHILEMIWNRPVPISIAPVHIRPPNIGACYKSCKGPGKGRILDYLQISLILGQYQIPKN